MTVLRAPNTVVIDGERLLAAKQSLQDPHHKLHAALACLTTQADEWLLHGPWTVTSKSEAPPGGSLHDYASQGPYWWPDPDSPDGLPYIQRDGERNPEVDRFRDRRALVKLCAAASTLALAWYYTDRVEYARHAVRILDTWFVNPKTAMSPHLNHAQGVPGLCTGRAIGIIDFSHEFTNVLDAVAILHTSTPEADNYTNDGADNNDNNNNNSTATTGWTSPRHASFVSWCSSFLHWLTTSPFGIEAANESNNHGSFANMQLTALALFTGDTPTAARHAGRAASLIDSQIAPDGSQPRELARTRSFHYANFNLCALLRWALVARKVGVDLFAHEGPEGQTLARAVEYVIPAAVRGPEAWAYEELEFLRYTATDNVRAAAVAGGLRAAQEVLGELEAPPGGDVFDLRPAPQHLDSLVKL